MNWYIVSATSEFRNGGVSNTCIGLGGDAWPLALQEYSSDEFKLHTEIMESREFVELQDGFGDMVVTNKALATTYLGACKDTMPLSNLALIICSSEVGDQVDCLGLDFGIPSGGYSLLESEICPPSAECSEDPPANNWFERLTEHGLMRTYEELLAYLEWRETNLPDGEDEASYHAVSVLGFEQ